MVESLASLIQAFPFAIASGLLIAIACSLLGVFVILKRVQFGLHFLTLLVQILLL